MRFLFVAALLAPAFAFATPLEVAVVVLDTGDAPVATGEAAEVRVTESRLFAVEIREGLVALATFGAVRVVPESPPGAELTVQGEILESTGLKRRVKINARDATGREWLNREYGLRAQSSAASPFSAMASMIAADLEKLRATLEPEVLTRIVTVAELQYAKKLAPRVFSGYLSEDAEGAVTVRRLPAEDDPMLSRIRRVRESEYAFVDTVDMHYAQLADQVMPTYQRWLEISRSNIRILEELRAQAGESGRRGLDRSRDLYADYREAKYQEATLRELAAAFDFEVTPSVIRLENEVIKLSGSIRHQYREWRSLLHAIWDSETGGVSSRGD